MTSYTAALYLQKAEVAWRRGEVRPDRITYALDAAELWGPEVDRACGVEEPAVDEWEAGTRYPTWEQLCALARLCGVTPWFFTFPATAEITGPVWICGAHTAQAVPPPTRITTYPREVVAAVVGGAT